VFDPFSGPAILLTAPSTEPQREIWLATRVGVEASLAFNESVSLHFAGPLDIEALRRALQALVARHEALRTTFSGDGLTLCVADAVTVDIPVLDASNAELAERDRMWHQMLARAVEEPFDLERGPLVRASLLRDGSNDHRAIFTAHHIVCDGWSSAVLIRDWAALYSADVNTVPAGLPRAVPFSTYARVQTDRIGSSQYAEDESYWVNQFSGDIPVLDLPTDCARPPLKTYASRREDLTLDVALVKRLKEVGAKERASLFTMLLAGFKAVLHRLSSQEDLVVGIPTAGQSVGGDEGLVGHCVHLLPLRSVIRGAEPYRDMLARLRVTMLDAMEHQQFTFGRLLERLPLRRDPSRMPLVSVIFNLDRGLDNNDLRFGKLAVELSTPPRHFESFDLFVNAVELNGEVVLECQYNTDLFDAGTIRQWLEMYRRLLEGVAQNVACEIDRLPLVPDTDLKVIAGWNLTAADFPRVCVHQLIEAQVQRTPDTTALEFEGRTISYGELNRRANQLARRLRASGVNKGTLVGLCLERSIEMVIGQLGILKAGGGYVPLDPGYPADRLAFMVSDSAMPLLLTERKLRDGLPLPAGQVLCIDDPGSSGQDGGNLPVDPASADPDSIAYVIYTSGSTGKPKGVLVPHRTVVNLLTSVREKPGMTASDVVLAITTLSFDIAVSELLLPLSVGARIVIASRDVASDGVQLLRLLRSTGVTFVDATPSTWRLLIDAGWDGREHLKAICTGEALPRDLAEQLVDRAQSAWNGYGPTETTVWSTFHEITRPVERVLIGRPIANTRIHILDKRMQPVPVGVPGELYIGGAGVTHGYLNRPDLTSERFVPDPFGGVPPSRLYRTGDIARYLRSGDIECLGRNDDQVKLRGFRIELGEIEEALTRHEAVGRVAVVAREDRPGDRRLVAYVVHRAGRSATEAELRAHLQTMLPSHMIPAAIVHLGAMPLTPSGKIDRRGLPAPATDRTTSTESFVAPRTPTEAMLAELWQQSLGVGRVSVHDDFFALGGHSLLASQVLARLRRDHGIEILFRKLFEAPTVARFAEVVDAQARTTDAKLAERSIERRPHDGLERLSVMQERVWLLEMMDPQQRAVHNLPAAWRLSGRLDPHVLHRSLDEIVARHETLRTSVRVTDGVGFQEVAPALSVPLAHLDLRDRPETDRQAVMMASLDAETRIPYDLSVAPLFRATLVRLDEEEHVLFILPHNVIWDGWSFDIFLRELGAVYAAFSDGGPSPLGPLAISYRDFAAWQREWLAGPERTRQEAWWRTQLAGDLPVLEIPLDHPRPAEPSRAGANIEIGLSRAEVDSLVAIAREAGATLFTILFSVFCVLLHRLTGQEDVLVGTPVRARTRPEAEDLIGPFMNMLVLRSRMETDLRFVQFLARVRGVTLDSFSHQELPLETVGIRPPILRAFFSLQDARSRPLGFGGLRVRQLHVLPPTSAADLMLWTMETSGGLVAMLNYSSELFDAATMHRFMARFRTLIAEVVRSPQQKVNELQLIPGSERALLRSIGDRPLEQPAACVHTLVERQAERTPRAVALMIGNRSVEYGELDDRATRLASELRSLGAGSQSRVAVHLERSAELVTALLAVMKTGAAWVMLDPADPAYRLAAILEDATPSVVITESGLRSRLPAGPALVVCVDEARAAQSAVPAPAPGETSLDAAACVLYASDAAGRSRGNALSHRTLASLAGALAQELGLAPHDIVLAVSPPSLDVSAIEWLAPMAVGARVALVETDVVLDPERLAEMAVTSGATLMMASSATWRDLLATGPRPLTGLKAICIGDLPSTELVSELVSRTAGAWVAHGFPEAGIWSTLHRVSKSDPNGVLGRPLGGTRVRIVDRDLHEVPLGVAGELCVGNGLRLDTAGGPDPDDRFVTLPEEPGERLYRSGESARWRSDSTLELVKGREGQVDLGGFRVELEEIAVALRRHPAVADAAVVLRRQDSGQSRLVAYIVLRPGHTYTDTELRRELRRTLPERMIPRAFTELSGLPRTAGGRLDRNALELSGRPSIEDYVAPESASEMMLAGLWREALGLERVSVHDNFFALGGYSLLCFQVLDRIERETGRRLSPRLLLLDSLRQVAVQLDNLPAKDPARKPEATRDAGILRRLGKLLPGSE
jgi:amino acid adenylation domain-containing protein